MLYELPPSTAVLPIRVDGQLCHPRQLMVQVKDPAAEAAIRALGLRIVSRVPKIGYVVVETPMGELQRFRGVLRSMDGLSAVDLDRAARIAYTPNDPRWPDQWHSRFLKLDKAWDLSLGTSGPIVAVLDTGINVAHEDLAANIWVNPGEIPANGIDDDANGYVDDVNGYDFANLDANPADDHGHGTACAGLVAAVGDNSLGVIGAAPRARIMAIKNANSSGYFYDSYTVPSYIYAADMGAKVFSMSYFADSVSRAEKSALNYALTKGVLPIAASGNDRTVYPYYPAAYEFVVAVAALNPDGTKAGFSDFGTWVDVSSPGVSLRTTTRDGGYTNGFAGTSGACPQVAGVAALLMGASPGSNAARIRRILEDTATPTTQAPFGEFANYGTINAEAAMKAATGPLPPLRSSVVRYVTGLGTAPVPTNLTARIYGRSLSRAVITQNGTVLPSLAASRDFVDYRLTGTNDPISVSVGGTTIATFRAPVPVGVTYPLVEGSSPNGSVTGGFFDTLAADTASLGVTTTGTNPLVLQATFRRVPASGKFTLVFRRAYPGTTGVPERIMLYRWASASFPYGPFDTIATSTTRVSPWQTTVTVNNIAPYVDFEGTVYLRVETDGLVSPSNPTMNVDLCYLRRGS